MNETPATNSSLVTVSSPHRVTVSSARTPIATRLATMADLPFMDGLQKQYHKQLGFFPRAQMEGYVEMGAVLVAEDVAWASRPCSLQKAQDMGETPMLLGYCISRDRYLKRDELGVIYQLCVVPGEQRKLIGATLVADVFARAAYGCRLFCCWCAQDLAANHFWESLGFVPLAFRAGSRGKRRVHIFWQRRIDADPSSITTHQSPAPYWYPFQTNAGAIREDRIVFPIPPGVHWKDVQAVEVPRVPNKDEGGRMKDERKRKKLPGPSSSSFIPHPSSLPGMVAILVGGRIKYVARPGYVAPKPEKAARRPKAETAPAPKIDPKYRAAARELRDRYLERVNDTLRLPALTSGKYDVSRTLANATVPMPAAVNGSTPVLSAVLPAPVAA